MPPKGIKASRLFQRKPKAKAVELVPRVHSRRTTHIQVEVGTSNTQQAQGRDVARMELDSHGSAFHEAGPEFMDVDEAFWIEEPDVPQAEQRRVSSRTYPWLKLFDMALVNSVPPTWKSLYLGSTPTWAISSVLKVSRLRQSARAVCLLHLNGGVPTAFLLCCSARSAAEIHTAGFLSTEFRGGQENTLFHHGCERLG
jgi:hypothetical protein